MYFGLYIESGVHLGFGVKEGRMDSVRAFSRLGLQKGR